MEVVVTTGAIRCPKLQSNHHHQQTNTQLFTGRMSFLSSNQQCRSTEGKNSCINYLAKYEYEQFEDQCKKRSLRHLDQHYLQLYSTYYNNIIQLYRCEPEVKHYCKRCNQGQ